MGWFPPGQFGQDLLFGVAPLAGVPLDLPDLSDTLGGIEEHGHVEARPGGPGVQREQPLGDAQLAGLDQHGPFELPVAVVVDGLEDGLAAGQEPEVLFHDLDVVAVGMQGRERFVGPLGAVVAVVVVDAQRHDPVLAQRLDQPPGQGRLPGCAVAGDGQHDRSGVLLASGHPRPWSQAIQYVSIKY